MKKVEVFSKKLDKSFVVALSDDNNVEEAVSFDELYQNDEQCEVVRADWNAWSNQGWNNWGAICI